MHRLTSEERLERDQKIVKMYRQGFPPRIIAERYGITTGRAGEILKENNASDPTRTWGDYRLTEV